MNFPEETAGPRHILYWSPRSPYVRKVLIVAHESGTIGNIELRPTVVLAAQPDDQLLGFNPLAQIPTLVTPLGEAIFDSTAICHYLDVEAGPNRMHPAAPAERTAMLRRQALGDGLIALLLSWLSERSRQQPDQSAMRIAAAHKKLPFILARLQQEVHAAQDAFDVGDASIVAALLYGDFRFSEHWVWRPRYPALAEWLHRVAQRPSVASTAYFDELAAARAENRETKVQQ